MKDPTAFSGDRPDDRHEAAALLPWYAAGTLDGDDRALVERHLSGCETCRAELAAERALAGLVAAEPEGGRSVDDGWRALAERLDAKRRAEPLAAAVAPRGSRRRWLRRGALSDPRRLRWLAGAQFVAIAMLAVVAVAPRERTGSYRALGDATTVRTGNVIAMFRPDTPEAAMRRTLTDAGARLVDGPTRAGAYVLDVPGGENGRALAALRADPRVTMAEPIEAAPAE